MIIDSYSNIFPFLSIGKEYRINDILIKDLDISFGANVFAGIKKANNYKKDIETGKYSSSGFTYEPIGGVSPTLKLHYKKLSINFYVSPTIKLNYNDKYYYAEGFIYTTFGYTF